MHLKNKYCVFDLETTIVHSFKRFANPFDKRNRAVVVATMIKGQDPVLYYDKEKTPELPEDFFEQFNFLVGHNLKFDLLYMWNNEKFQQWLKAGGRVLDTMSTEYLITAQQAVYASLDSLSEKYGGELKDDKISQYFKAGFGSDEIDPDLLLPYAEGDVINTEIIMQGQVQEAKKNQMMPVVLAYMEHYLALCEMEANGLHFDVPKAKKMQKKLEIETVKLRKDLIEQSKKMWTIPVEFNPDSKEHISGLLFNSKLAVVEDIKLKDDDGEYLRYGPKAQKAGQIKTRKEKVEHVNKGFGVALGHTRPTKKEGVYAVDDKVLKAVAKFAGGAAKKFCEDLHEYRNKTKFLNTYLYGQKWKNKTEYDETGLIPLAMPENDCIHHTLDTVQTKTGRVNSKNPNGQNIPKDLLKLFTSRFGKKGKMVAIDYSQLEVRVQAYLAQCPQMIQDIKDGMDFHCLRLAYAEDMNYNEVVELCSTSEEWALKRKKAKTISFQKAYGASPHSLAASTGLTVETVTKIFDKEDLRYPEVKAYYEDVQEQVKRSRVPTPRLIFMYDKRGGDTITRPGEYQGIGYYTSITGKRYHFQERAVITKRGDVFRYFSIPDIYNFMVQGTAADIVSTQVGKVFRYLLDKRDKCLLVNEVHDEIVLDIKEEYIDEIIPEVEKILESVDKSFQEQFGVKFNVPIEVETSIGDSWGDCK